MSAITHGMDVADTRRLAGQLDRHAQVFTAACRDIGSTLTRAAWLGRDAETFRADWQQKLAPSLTQSAERLDALAEALRQQAQEQERASQATALAFGFGGPLLLPWGDLIGEAAERINQVTDWIGGEVSEGVAWANDAIGDLWESVGPRLDAAGVGLERVGLAGDVFADNVLGIFSGDIPTPAEVGASLVLLGGTGLGVAANAVTGQDRRFFDDGTPRTGSITDVTRGGGPTSLTESLGVIQRGYDEDELVVSAQVGQDGVTRFAVSVPGTQADIDRLRGWSGQANGRDWPANLWGIASGTSAGTEAAEVAILQAIEAHTAAHPEAVIGDKPQVLLNGHSQGGIMSANMSANPSFTAQVDVVAVTALGAPVDSAHVPADTPVLSVQHGGPTELGDFIPRLDLGGWPGTPGHITNVPLDAPGGGNPFQIRANHELDGYLTSLGGGEGQQALRDWVAAHPEVEQFYNGDPDQSVRYDIGFGRE